MMTDDLTNRLVLLGFILGGLGFFIGLVRTVISLPEHQPNRAYRHNHKDFLCVCNHHFTSRWSMWWHIYIEWFDAHFNCWCGHAKSEHVGFSGPNSIGQWSRGECKHGSEAIGPYRVGGCGCLNWKRRLRTLGRRVSIG